MHMRQSRHTSSCRRSSTSSFCEFQKSAERGSNPDKTLLDRVDALLEATGVRLLGARERLEPLGDVLEALVTRGLGEAGIHLGVLVGLAGDGGLEVLARVADRLAGGRIADDLQEIEMAVRMAGLALGGVAEQAG